MGPGLISQAAKDGDLGVVKQLLMNGTSPSAATVTVELHLYLHEYRILYSVLLTKAA